MSGTTEGDSPLSIGNPRIEEIAARENLNRLKLSAEPAQSPVKHNNANDVVPPSEVVKDEAAKKEDGEESARGQNDDPVPAAPTETEDDDASNIGPNSVGTFFYFVETTEEERELLEKELEEREKVQDANNMTDPTNVPKMGLTGIVDEKWIQKEPPLTLNDVRLKCCEVRWHYTNSKGKTYLPFNGRDSLLIEYRYRLDNNIPIDNDSWLIINSLLPDMKTESDSLKESGRKRQDSFSSTESTEQEEGIIKNKLIPLLNNLYKLNYDYTEIRPIFWKNDSLNIRRGVLFTLDKQPIDPNEADKIQKHLEEFVEADIGEGDQTVPPDLQTDEALYEFAAHNEITAKIGKYLPAPLEKFFKEAEWKDKCTRIKHLVFVIHGVANDNYQDDVVKNAKLLTKGVDSAACDSSGILFLPVHWRSHISPDISSNSIPKIDFGVIIGKLVDWFANDAKLYISPEKGQEIRNFIIKKLNRLYKKFLKVVGVYRGTVSILGHSLGSVISYDILTNYTEVKATDILPVLTGRDLTFNVSELFAVGSPLKEFLELKGGSAKDLFLDTLGLVRIYNVYHPTDAISRRLEPYANNLYEYMNPAEIMIPGDALHRTSVIISKSLWKIVSSPVRLAFNIWRAKTKIHHGHNLPYRLDYVLEKHERWRQIQSHSVYWTDPGFAHFLLFNVGKKTPRPVDRMDLGDMAGLQNPNGNNTNPEPADISMSKK